MATYPSITQRDMMKIVATAAVIDLIEAPLTFVPVIGWLGIGLIDIIAWVTFYIWFRRLGVSFLNFPRFLYFNSGLLLDLVPFINIFAWTLDVSMVLWSVKQEERQQNLTI
jgi:hypothetical protein